MRSDDAPDYLEAFPALEMVHAAKVRDRTRWVTWFDGNREEVGFGRVTWDDWQIDFAFNLRSVVATQQVSTRRKLATQPVARGSHSFRFHVICRTCGRYVYRLFYRTEDWLCKECQHLRNRSTFLSPQMRWQEEYDGLRFEVGEGRPWGMREKDFVQRRMRMAALAPKLDGTRRRPGPEFFRLIFAEWSDRDPRG